MRRWNYILLTKVNDFFSIGLLNRGGGITIVIPVKGAAKQSLLAELVFAVFFLQSLKFVLPLTKIKSPAFACQAFLQRRRD